MREIKFRCWFANKMWHSIPAIRFQELGVLRVDLNHDVGDFSGTPDTWTGEDDYELMQFTGLHDKNGKPIFEGDVIGRKSFIPKVISHNGVNFCFYHINNPYGEKFNLNHCSFDGHDEVIGNIYQNPELLGGVS